MTGFRGMLLSFVAAFAGYFLTRLVDGFLDVDPESIGNDLRRSSPV